MIAGLIAGSISKVAVDPYWANVALAMHMDGADNGTTFTEQKSKSITNTSCVTKTAVKKYGTASAYFNGGAKLVVGNYSDLYLSTGSWTVELFMNASNVTGPGNLVSQRGYAGNGLTLRVYSNKINCFNGGGGNQFSSTNNVSTGTWYHIALVKNGTAVTLYIDGVNNGTSTWNVDMGSASGTDIGVWGTGEYFNGYIDDLRITKLARYTANFTPPTKAFPNS